MGDQVNVQYAKTHLSALLARVERGENVTIARDGKPIARLVALSDAPSRNLGFARDIPDFPDAFYFDAPAESELAEWEG